MARRPATDERQVDIFGAAPPPPKPVLPRRKQPAPEAAVPEPAPPERTPPEPPPPPKPPLPPEPPPPPSLDALAARICAPELDELLHALPDDMLAHAALSAVRQLRRRAARSAGRGGKKGGLSALQRASAQLATELGGHGEYE